MLVFIAVLATQWHVFLLGAVAMVAAAWLARGLRRALALAAAAILSIGAVVGGMFAAMQRDSEARLAAHYAVRQARLDAETIINGIALPAGTEVTWAVSPSSEFVRATMPGPTDVLGVSAVRVTRKDDGWVLEVERPQEIGGWPCGGNLVTVGPDGSLRSCGLSRQVEWHGWTLPARTSVTPRGPDRGLEIFLPYGAVVLAREIERPLPPDASLNADGSLDGTAFHFEDPLVVRGVALINQVRWRYDPATLGMGRDRPPVAVEGGSMPVPLGNGQVRPSERIVVRLSDGAVTQE